MNKVKLNSTLPEYPLFLLLICLILFACSEKPQSGELKTVEAGPPVLDSSPSTQVSEDPKIPARRTANNPLPAVVDLQLAKVSSDPSSQQLPAVIEARLAGRDINSVAVVAGRHGEEGGGQGLVTYQPIGAGSTDQDWPFQWPDGVHDLSYIWYSEGDYLEDGSTGDFVLLWEIEPESQLRTVNGQYRREGDSDFLLAALLVDINTSQASELLDMTSGEEIIPVEGDQFQILNLRLDDSGATVSDPGEILTFGEQGILFYQRRALPEGNYFLGFIAEGGAGMADSVFANFVVSDETSLPDKRVLFQPDHGYQLLYSREWSEFSTLSPQLISAEISDTLKLQIMVDSKPDQDRASAMKEEVLTSVGDVQVLYEDQVQIGLQNGQRTAYGYESPTGLRTGILLSFGYDGREYIVDVDGPSTQEEAILEVAEGLVKGWRWRPVTSSNQDVIWRGVDIDGYHTVVPSNLQYHLLENGWHRLSDSSDDIFFAIRVEPEQGNALSGRLSHWLEVAGREVEEFESSDIYEIELSEKIWLRVDFQYGDDETWGAIMAIESGEDYIVAWFEAPEADFGQMEETVVTLTLADLFND